MQPKLSTKIAKNLTSAKAAWLEERRGYLGATDIGAILKLNPYRSPHDVWLDKKGLKDDEENIAMRAGTYMEPFIAQEFRRLHPCNIRKSQTYRHPKFPHLACNPDREITFKGIPAILECKNVGTWAAKNFGQDGADQLPEHYLAQIHWQLIITRKPLVVLAALIDDRELRTFCYSLNHEHSTFAHIFDPEATKAMFNYALFWWKTHIEEGIEPELTGHESDTEFVKGKRYGYTEAKITNTDVHHDAIAVQLKEDVKALANLNEKVEEAKNKLKLFMTEDEATMLESSVGTFTWKTNKNGVATFNMPFRSGRA